MFKLVCGVVILCVVASVASADETLADQVKAQLSAPTVADVDTGKCRNAVMQQVYTNLIMLYANEIGKTSRSETGLALEDFYQTVEGVCKQLVAAAPEAQAEISKIEATTPKPRVHSGDDDDEDDDFDIVADDEDEDSVSDSSHSDSIQDLIEQHEQGEIKTTQSEAERQQKACACILGDSKHSHELLTFNQHMG